MGINIELGTFRISKVRGTEQGEAVRRPCDDNFKNFVFNHNYVIVGIYKPCDDNLKNFIFNDNYVIVVFNHNYVITGIKT